MQNELDQMLDLLKDARELSASARETKRKIVEDAQATAEYKAADATTNTADETIAQLEARIRAMTLDLHGIAAELPDRVSVKNFKVVEYKADTARDWCFTNFRLALVLDAKAFEKAAKDGNIPACIATVKTEARPQIATKL